MTSNHKTHADRRGASFTDDYDNPTVEVHYTVHRMSGGVSVEGDLYPYQKFADDGTQNGEFSDFRYSLTRAELVAYRDMLTALIDATA